MLPGKSAFKLFITSVVACVSFGVSSAAPVLSSPSTTVNRPAEAASVPLPSSPTPLSPSSSPTTLGTGASAATSAGSSGENSINNARSVHPHVIESARSSFGLALGQIDYAATGIARRVSRIFVHRRTSVQEMREEKSEAEPEQEGRGQADPHGEHDGDGTVLLVPVPPVPPTLPPPRAHHVDADQALADRACRWGCF